MDRVANLAQECLFQLHILMVSQSDHADADVGVHLFNGFRQSLSLLRCYIKGVMSLWVPVLLSSLYCGLAFAQCDTIPAIRGQGSPSSCAGKTVTVSGVVTLPAGGLSGFF